MTCTLGDNMLLIVKEEIIKPEYDMVWIRKREIYSTFVLFACKDVATTSQLSNVTTIQKQQGIQERAERRKASNLGQQ